MDSLLRLGVAALLLFAVTNIDDLLLLVVIGADPRRGYPSSGVLAGQLLGFSAILAISLLGYWTGMAVSPRWMACLGLVPLILGLRQLWVLGIAASGGSEDEKVTGFLGHPERGTALPATWRRTTVKIAALTVANGSDNISVYLPLFGRLDGPALLLTVTVFYAALFGLWWAAQWLVHHPRWQQVLQALGPRLSPLVLIGLGIWLVKDSLLWPWSA